MSGRKRLGVDKECRVCGCIFYARKSAISRGGGIYCSRSCSSKNKVTNLGKFAQKGNIPKTHFKPREHKFKGTISEYKHLHYVIGRKLGKPQECSQCGAKKYVEWANLSNQYKQDVSDWMSLCKKCHFRHDNMHERMIYATN